MDVFFRKARIDDIPEVSKIYEKIIKDHEEGGCAISWVRGVYPTEKTARQALNQGELYVGEYQGQICSSAIINQRQLDVYEKVNWRYPAADEKILVLHTFGVDPDFSRKGIGKAFIRFYERLAEEKGCSYLRLDTSACNERAQTMYKKLGYEIVGKGTTEVNGVKDVKLFMLEKALEPAPYPQELSQDFIGQEGAGLLSFSHKIGP